MEPGLTQTPEYRPRFPRGASLGIGILGCGKIAQSAHLPAYTAYGLDVASVWSRTEATVATIMQRFPTVRSVAGSLDALLGNPAVDIVDIATPAANRLDLVAAAVRAGKHVLAQKPLTTELASLPPLLDEAANRGVRIAVNQNARWAPAWRVATRLVDLGAIGEVVGVTHIHDKPLPPLVGTPFDDLPHMLVVDYLAHWIDITRCWLRGKTVEAVHAHETRVPRQPLDAKNPWSVTIGLTCEDGAHGMIRVVGDVHATKPGCPFWIHGTEGTIRGSILGGSDRVQLDRSEGVTNYPLEGQWFVDGFAGAMGELMCAIAEDREPEHSARDNIATLRLIGAARDSVEHGGASVQTDGLVL